MLMQNNYLYLQKKHTMSTYTQSLYQMKFIPNEMNITDRAKTEELLNL